MKLIGSDLWFLRRQQWIDALQSKPGDDIRDMIRVVVLGLIVTACLIVWHYGMGFGHE